MAAEFATDGAIKDLRRDLRAHTVSLSRRTGAAYAHLLGLWVWLC